MGEARQRELAQRDVAFSRTHRCIFCGGGKDGTTVDHYPPRGLFSHKKWPEGYVFPACFDCNQGSKDAENWMAFLVRIYSQTPPPSQLNPGTDEELAKVFKHLARRNPGIIEEMRVSTPKRRDLFRRLDIHLQPGQLHKDIPLMHVPQAAKEAVPIFAEKLAKALHFHHTGSIVHEDAELHHLWYTNVNIAEGRVPEELRALPARAKVYRGRVDLSDQFDYQFAVAQDGRGSMFWVRFRLSLWIAAMVVHPDLAQR